MLPTLRSVPSTGALPDRDRQAYGLLQHDRVERFLLHYFALSAHGYTRGTLTAPEASDVSDRDAPSAPYTAAGEVGATVYLKWLLCFEEPEARTLWLGKATPREWLAAGGEPLLASGLTTRYGRVSFAFHPPARGAAAFAVRVNVSLPPSFATVAPAGGVRVRLRAPLAHAGRLSRVTVGGATWAGFSAAEESVDFTAAQLTAGLLRDGLPRIVATFAAAAAAPLRPVRAGTAHVPHANPAPQAESG